jgi:hypothetical protein
MVGGPLRVFAVAARQLEPRQEYAIAVAFRAVVALAAALAFIVIEVAIIVGVDALTFVVLKLTSRTIGIGIATAAYAARFVSHDSNLEVVAFARADRR